MKFVRGLIGKKKKKVKERDRKRKEEEKECRVEHTNVSAK